MNYIYGILWHYVVVYCHFLVARKGWNTVGCKVKCNINDATNGATNGGIIDINNDAIDRANGTFDSATDGAL